MHSWGSPIKAKKRSTAESVKEYELKRIPTDYSAVGDPDVFNARIPRIQYDFDFS